MKKILIYLILLSGLRSYVIAQTTQVLHTMPAAYDSVIQYNFIRVYTPSRPFAFGTEVMDTSRRLKEVKVSTQYIDGLGRVFQTVDKGISPLGHDLITPIEYDSLGRVVYQYLSYVDTVGTGDLKMDPFNSQNRFEKSLYNPGNDPMGEKFFYGTTTYDAYPGGPVIKSTAPGNSWAGNGRGVSTNYESNGDSEVRIWQIDTAAQAIPNSSKSYRKGQLLRLVSIDEHGYMAIQYQDKQGNIILKKVQVSGTDKTSHIGWLCTYYVYDEFNQLRFVIPPKAVEYIAAHNWDLTSDATLSNNLCFRYTYDDRGRLIIKKVPGADEEWMIYDALDRLVLSQNANLRAQTKWLFIKYDVFNRPIVTGFYQDGTHNSQALMQTYLNGQNMTLHENYQTATFPLYSLNQSFPVVTFADVQTITYYDNYSWGGWYGNYGAKDNSYDGYFATPSNTVYPYPQPLTQSTAVTGLVTGVWDVNGLLRGMYYDDHGRVIQTKSYNQSTKVDITTTQYDFAGKVLQTYLRHEKGEASPQVHTVKTVYKYDSAGQLKSTWQNIDSLGDQLIDSIQYNELRQLQTKYLGSGLDNIVYDYNIRGWLTGINKQYVGGGNNHYFGQELSYDNLVSVVPGSNYTAAQYNDNIAGLTWKTKGDSTKRKYDFTYDNINRLTGANFQQSISSGGWSTSLVNYTVGNLNYDANGNILSMQQQGFKWNGSSLIDSLTYRYSNSSNKLYRVTDGGYDSLSHLGDFNYKTRQDTIDYQYDASGNLSVDNNKGLEISYNHLNLPTWIHVRGKGNIQYIYDGFGNKQWKLVIDSLSKHTIKTLYINGFVYELRDTLINPTLSQATLQYLSHDEGRWRWAQHFYQNGTTGYRWENDFFERDYLGNTRMVLTTQKDTGFYAATMDSAYRTKENTLFYNIPQTAYSRTLAGYPVETSMTNPNDSVIMVNGTVGRTQGPAIILKVMAGDSIALGVRSFYTSQSPTGTRSSIDDVLFSLAGGIVGMTGGTKGGMGDLNNHNSPLYGVLDRFITGKDTTIPNKPRAYLNWMLLDDQFKYDSAKSGAVPVSNFAAGTLGALAKPDLVAGKNGFLYVWVSNETQGWPVFFDNLTITTYAGRIVEETHYYPFGLTMAGISDKALKGGYAENKYRYNKGSELQNKEFSNGSGLEMYETHFREFDPQLARWWQLDPKPSNEESLYSAMANNPILRNDPLGDTLDFPMQDPDYIAQFYDAFAYLDAHGVGDNLLKLQQAKQHIQVLSITGHKSAEFDYNSDGVSTLFWNPRDALEIGNVIISPATVLDHEAAHGVQAIYHTKEFIKLNNIPDKAYDDKEERRVIMGREQKTAKALGEIKEGKVTRTNHNTGGVIKVLDPTSTTSSAEKTIFEILKSKKDLEKKYHPNP